MNTEDRVRDWDLGRDRDRDRERGWGRRDAQDEHGDDDPLGIGTVAPAERKR